VNDLGEHIEEIGKLMRENGERLDADEIAAAVLDIAFAQGLVEEHELDLAAVQVANQARYIWNLR
jgi:hypothetical protein